MATNEGLISVSAVTEQLTKQFQALLMMLREAIELCPDNLWDRESDTNRSWQIAYHALYFTHCYAQPSFEQFAEWGGQHQPSQNDDGIGGQPDPKSALPFLPDPYSKAEILEYWQFCWDNIADWLAAGDVASSESGFSWYEVPKLEHLLVNLRHTSLHTGQLMERVRANCDLGVRWRGTWPPKNPTPPTA